MAQSEYWKTVNYHNLPQWMKRVSKPKQWVNKTYTKIFYGKPYDYQVEYKVIRGKLDISYWRSGHKVNTADLEAQIVTKKKELKSLEIGPKLLFLVGLIGLLFYGLGIILIILWLYYRGRWEAQKTNLQNDITKLWNEIDYENREWITEMTNLWQLYEEEGELARGW